LGVVQDDCACFLVIENDFGSFEHFFCFVVPYGGRCFFGAMILASKIEGSCLIVTWVMLV